MGYKMKCEKCNREFSDSVFPLHIAICKAKESEKLIDDIKDESDGNKEVHFTQKQEVTKKGKK